MSEVWTTLRVLDWTTSRFQRAGVDTPRLDAQVLLAHVLRCERVALYTSFDKPLEEAELLAYRGLIKRRLEGEPVAYLTGQQEFWSMRFAVDSRVLIPRPDTETLVQAALELGDTLGNATDPLLVAEIATGSAAVACALAHERKHWQIVATDLSEPALQVARSNAETLGLGERIEFRQGHLLEPLLSQRLGEQTFALLIANLPYVSEADMETLSPEVRREPKGALFGGPTGVELIEELAKGATNVLRPGGCVALEHGFDQGELVRAIAASAGFLDVQTRADLAGRARVTSFRRGDGS